jgi:hypothetical protein
MNAIILARSETLLSSVAAATPVFNADEIIGWKTEAQRLALGANRCTACAPTSKHYATGTPTPVTSIPADINLQPAPTATSGHETCLQYA